MKSEGSLPYTQEPAHGPYSESYESNLHIKISFLSLSILKLLSYPHLITEAILKFCNHIRSPRMCYVLHLSHPLCFISLEMFGEVYNLRNTLE